MSTRFVMISRWRLAVPRERVWHLLTETRDWPRWWPNVAAVRRWRQGSAEGLGTVDEFHWRSGLGYRFRILVETVRLREGRELEAAARGDLRGTGLWLLEPADEASVRVTYRWEVELNKRWMRRLAPLLRPVFAWRHFAVMANGARGMARELNCALSEIEDCLVATSSGPASARLP
jgi:hypothetical protein